MIFLNPAVLFGLLAASIPVLIHLLNLRKLKRIDFSTLAFLKEMQKNKIRKIKLKQWLLLALRVLIILFLVTAFARPTLKGIAIGGTTSAAKTTAVFVLDNTSSMSVVDAKGSYLNQAKATMKQLVSQLQEGDEAALILVSDHGREVLKPTSNLSQFVKEINEVQISDASGTLHEAIVKAGEILSHSQNFNKEIYILSDFQSGRLYNPGSLSDLRELLNDKMRLYTFDYAGKKVFNLGIDAFKLDTQIFEKDKPVNFSVTVTNYSEQPANNIVVSLYINGKRSSQQSVSLSPGDSKVLSMQAAVSATGFVKAFAEIEDDDILQDNKRYLNFYIPKEVPVVIFSENNKSSQFVDLALTAGGNGGTLKLTVRNLNQIASLDLTQFSVVIIIGSEITTGLDRLKSYVQNGGSIFLMPAESPDIQKFRKITTALGLPAPVGVVGQLNGVKNAIVFDKVDFNHPVFHDIFSEKQKKNIVSPEIYLHYNIKTQGRGNDIISLVDGSSFLSEYKLGKGKLFLLNISPVLSWSNFPLKSIFAPLINKSVFYLASPGRTSTDYLAGNPVDINLRNRSLPQIKIVKPDKSEDYLNLENKSNTNYINFSQTNIAGTYDVLSGSKVIEEFSVNTDPRESVTKYLNVNDFKEYLKKIDFKGKFINVSKDANPVQVVKQSRFGSELWKYFILAAIILAIIEMTIARNAKKDSLDNP